MMKKLKFILLTLCIIGSMLMPIDVKAAAFSMYASKSSVSPNETFTVTLSGKVTGNIYISVTNGTASDKQVWIENNSVKVTVKAGSSGTVTVKATPGKGLSDNNGKAVSDTSSATVSVSIKKPVVTYDVSLKSIDVNGKTLELGSNNTYKEIELPKGTPSVNINAKAKDSNVNISGIGKVSVKPGSNKLEVTTKHPESNQKKTYYVNIYVEEEPLLMLDYNETKLGVYPNFRGAEKLNGFEDVTLTVNDKSIVGKTNGKGLNLLYMVNENSEKQYYIYKDNNLIPYNPITISNIKFITQEIPEELKSMQGLTQQKIKIDNYEINGWIYEDEAMSNYQLLYLMNESGESHIYQYETTEKTIQLYSDRMFDLQEEITQLKDELDTIKKTSYVMMTLLIMSLITLIVVIIRIKKHK